MNLDLKKEIIGSGKKCIDVAKILDWHPSKISLIINKTYSPTDEEKDQLAKAVGVDVDKIFQSQKTVTI